MRSAFQFYCNQFKRLSTQILGSMFKGIQITYIPNIPLHFHHAAVGKSVTAVVLGQKNADERWMTVRRRFLMGTVLDAKNPNLLILKFHSVVVRIGLNWIDWSCHGRASSWGQNNRDDDSNSTQLAIRSYFQTTALHFEGLSIPGPPPWTRLELAPAETSLGSDLAVSCCESGGPEKTSPCPPGGGFPPERMQAARRCPASARPQSLKNSETFDGLWASTATESPERRRPGWKLSLLRVFLQPEAPHTALDPNRQRQDATVGAPTCEQEVPFVLHRNSLQLPF